MSAMSEPRDGAPKAEKPRVVADRPASRQDLSALARHLGGEQAKGQASLDARLAEIEAAVNRIEGRLFVELHPLLQHAVADGLDMKPTRRRRIGPALLLLLVGLGLGTGFGDQIHDLGKAGIFRASAFFVPEGEHSGTELSD